MRSLFPSLILVLLVACSALAADEARLLRQPTINGDTVVFVYAGDLWTVPSTGGTARRLTAFKGVELFPVLSPDGQWIAFSGEYSGTRQIHVIPVEGGAPRQLTFYPDVGQMPPRGGWDNIPIDWTPDGKVLFRSNRTPYGQRVSRYFVVDPSGNGMEQPLQIPEGGPASLSPDGRRLAYNIKSREFRTWKRYKAGRAQDLWIYDLDADTVRRLTTFSGTDAFPMWVGETIYFVSDRASVESEEPRTLNIFAYDLATDTMRQVTRFTDFDCLWPSRGVGGIVFENGGYIHLLDTDTDDVRRLDVAIHDDRPHARSTHKNVEELIDSYEVSPSGKRAIFSARGDVFTVPAKHGDIRNLTRTAAVREMDVGWSPDGKFVSYVSEAPGDYELFLRPYHDDGPTVQVTADTEAWITGYVWSPDSSKIVVADTMHRLRLVDVATREVNEIDRGTYSPIVGATWSADSQWLAYAKDGVNRMTSIWLYSVADATSRQLTDGRRDDLAPAFDPKGEYLFFVSQRDFDRRTRRFQSVLLAGALRADLPPLFEPRDDDEEPPDTEDDNGDDSGDGKDETAGDDEPSNGNGDGEPPEVEVDFEGFEARVVAFPLDSGGYRSLTPVEGGLLYLRDGDLYRFDLEKREEKTVMEKVSGFVLTAEGEHLLYRSGSTWGIAEASPGQKTGEGKLDLSGMEMRISPAVEWNQIYTDAWRIMRDWFYDPDMHGVDWKAMHDKYQVLVPHVAHRADLDYVLGELIGELNAGHTYVFAGDQAELERVPVGVLGCELEPEGAYYRIARVFAGEPWRDRTRSPVAESGVNIEQGEYLLAIDGEGLRTDSNPYRLLENKVGRQVTLLVSDTPSEDGAREVVVRPVASERSLRHLDWVERNRALVDRLSGGRIGYIYVPDTSFGGFEAFYRGWFDQASKDGLIIDERYNGGGQGPAPMVFDMSHPVLSYWARRHLELGSSPTFAHEGPKVMLINGRSSSGGDAFPANFRAMNLGPLMGQTTWGGLIGYGYSPSFVDGGGMAVPAFAYVNTEGEWDVEYYGVEPDIEVFDDPTLIQAGREPMIERAVQYILEQLEKNPPTKVETPEGPDRS